MAGELDSATVTWIVGLIVTGVVGVFQFLSKKAYTDISEGIKDLRKGIETVNEKIAAFDKEHTSISKDVEHLKDKQREHVARILKLEETVHELEKKRRR